MKKVAIILGLVAWSPSHLALANQAENRTCELLEKAIDCQQHEVADNGNLALVSYRDAEPEADEDALSYVIYSYKEDALSDSIEMGTFRVRVTRPGLTFGHPEHLEYLVVRKDLQIGFEADSNGFPYVKFFFKEKRRNYLSANQPFSTSELKEVSLYACHPNVSSPFSCELYSDRTRTFRLKVTKNDRWPIKDLRTFFPATGLSEVKLPKPFTYGTGYTEFLESPNHKVFASPFVLKTMKGRRNQLVEISSEIAIKSIYSVRFGLESFSNFACSDLDESYPVWPSFRADILEDVEGGYYAFLEPDTSNHIDYWLGQESERVIDWVIAKAGKIEVYPHNESILVSSPCINL